jgi:hypothetical protein
VSLNGQRPADRRGWRWLLIEAVIIIASGVCAVALIVLVVDLVGRG